MISGVRDAINQTLGTPGTGYIVFESKWVKTGRIITATGSRWGIVAEKTLRRRSSMLVPQKEIKGPHTLVGIGRGLTLNLGDFESVRVDEFLVMPVNTNPAEIEAARKDIRREVETHVEAEMVRVKGTIEQKASMVAKGHLSLEDFNPEEAAQIEGTIKTLFEAAPK